MSGVGTSELKQPSSTGCSRSPPEPPRAGPDHGTSRSLQQNPSAFVELQQRFVREYLDVLLQGTATVVRATRRTADETLHPLEQQIAERRQANLNQRYPHAAE